MKRYELDMDNDNMHGHWVGSFSYDNQRTVVDFIENITAKKLVLKPFVGMYLKKQQTAYMADLKKALGL
ncbi:hypothetical protein OBV_02200 [Oscillibacter valericigenes Sjm18-20]|nr:hypothetical protein OBV_02200 [Oscillibacter valericigenes Sjm18-20]